MCEVSVKPNQVLPMFPWMQFYGGGDERLFIAFMGAQAVIVKEHDEPGLTYRAIGMLPVVKIGEQLSPERAQHVGGASVSCWDLAAERLSHPYDGMPSVATLPLKLETTARDALLKIVGEYLDGYRPIYVGRFGPRECVNQFDEVRYDYGLSASPAEHWKTVAVRKNVGSLWMKRAGGSLMVRFDGSRVEERFFGPPLESVKCDELENVDRAYEIASDGALPWWGRMRAPSAGLVTVARDLSASTGAYVDDLIQVFLTGIEAVPGCDLSSAGHYSRCAIVRPQSTDSQLVLHRYDLSGHKIGDDADSCSIASFLVEFWSAIEKHTGFKFYGDTMFTQRETKLLGTFLFGTRFD